MRLWQIIPAAAVALAVQCALALEPDTAIYVMDLEGSGLRKVIDVEGYTYLQAPRWSPDGKQLLFMAVSKQAGGLNACFVVGVDGQGLRKIGPGEFPDWSPDGKQIVYQSTPPGSQIVVQGLDGKGESQLVEGYSPRWSPDGRKLAFHRETNAYVLDLISGEEHALLQTPVYLVRDGMDWSPDSKRLAVTVRPERNAARALLVLDPDQDNQPFAPRLRIDTSGLCSFSPDGKQLVFEAGWKVRLVAVEGNEQPRLLPGQLGHNVHPDFSPDGKWIAFASDRHTVSP